MTPFASRIDKGRVSPMANLGRRKEDLPADDSTSLQGILTPDLTLKSINAAWEKLLGYSREMLLA